jgi:RNA-binding protein YlmH
MASEIKEKILRFYRGTEGSEIAIKLADLAEIAQKSQKFRLTGFLDPFAQEIAETIAANYPMLRVEFDGGYQGAERCRAMFRESDFRGQPGFDIAVVKAVWNGQFVRIGHRDVLGSLMSLGIDRSKIGDILAGGDNARILCDKQMAEYLLENLTTIGGTSVKCERDELTAIVPREERTKEIRTTVASLRVDSIASAGFGFSRSRAANDIKADKLKLNWQTVDSPSTAVKAGDVLSMRGRGRLEVTEICGQTKKGRISVVLKRFM